MGKKRYKVVGKGGRPRNEGAREPNGRIQRNVTDEGTPQIKARKEIITRSTVQELTPLGILAGHGLITEAMYHGASRYKAVHCAAYPDRPDAPLPYLAKLPSEQWPHDIEHAMAKAKRVQPTVDELRDIYQDMRNRLTTDQQEIVHTLAIFDEWPHVIERMAFEIISHRMRWDDSAGLIHGTPPSTALKKAVSAIRDALEALTAPKRRLYIVNEKVVDLPQIGV